MIPGVHLSGEEEQRVWQRFATWADHFRNRLASGGLSALLADYDQLLRSVETQSCHHGGLNTGADWRACCGLVYEYLNDLSVRDALEVLIEEAGPPESERLRAVIDPLDVRLRNLLFASGSHDYPTTADSTRKSWWHTRLPAAIEP